MTYVSIKRLYISEWMFYTDDAVVKPNHDNNATTMQYLHHNLEAVKASCLRALHLGHESLNKILIHNTVTGGEKCQNVLDEVLLVVLRKQSE